MSYRTHRFLNIWHLLLVSLLFTAPISLSAPQKDKATKVAGKDHKKAVKNTKGKVTKAPAKGTATKGTVTKGQKATKGAKAEATKKGVKAGKTRKNTKKVSNTAPAVAPSADADLDASFDDEQSSSSGPWLLVFVLFILVCILVLYRKQLNASKESRENFHRNSTHEGAFSTNMKSLMSGDKIKESSGFGAVLKGLFGNRGSSRQVPSSIGSDDGTTDVNTFTTSVPATSLASAKSKKGRAS